MDEKTQELLKKQFSALPLAVQKAITSVNLHEKLQEIVKNNKLMLDQGGGLETETNLVLFGIEPLDKYLKNLMDNVGLTSIQASVIAHDVNELIFKNIREELKKINGQIAQEQKNLTERPEPPTKEEIIAGIEKPSDIKNTEPSVSMSAISNLPKPEMHPEMAKEGIEIRVSHLPEVAPEIKLPMVSSIQQLKSEPIHINIPPVQNIVETKLKETVAVPKAEIVVEEKTKLPEKQKIAGDPYREAAI